MSLDISPLSNPSASSIYIYIYIHIYRYTYIHTYIHTYPSTRHLLRPPCLDKKASMFTLLGHGREPPRPQPCPIYLCVLRANTAGHTEPCRHPVFMVIEWEKHM